MGPLPVLPQDLAGRFVLVVPEGTAVVPLARAWFADAAADVPTPRRAPAPQQRAVGARFRGIAVEEAPPPEPVRVALGATTALVGPTTLGPEAAAEAGIGERARDLWALHVDAGPSAARDEQLVVGWMLAAARRAGGAVVPADRSRLVVPDAGAAVDLTLWSAVPLGAAEAVPLVRPALAGARLQPVREHPAEPGAPRPFTLTGTYEYDGALVVRTERSAHVPVVLSTLDWREYGPWAYHVAWEPLEPPQGEAEVPSPLHVIARQRVGPSVARVVTALRQAAGGVVVDSGGFVVDAAELRARSSR